MDAKKIQKKISDSIAKAQESGFTLICEDWGDDNQKCACPLGCLIVSSGTALDKPGKNFTKASELLEQDQEWIDSFIAGYDRSFLTYGQEPIKEAYDMGQKFRKELDPLRYHVYLAKRHHDQN